MIRYDANIGAYLSLDVTMIKDKIVNIKHYPDGSTIWIDLTEDPVELNLGTQPIKLNIGGGVQNTVEIEKLFGPMIAEDVRVYLDDKKWEWVVERYSIEWERWEEKARWNCQESYPQDQEAYYERKHREFLDEESK